MVGRQQFRNGLPMTGGSHQLILHDRDAILAPDVDEALRTMECRPLKTPARVPTANAHCERFIGTVRRECLNWMIPLHEWHFRRLLPEWFAHLQRQAAGQRSWARRSRRNSTSRCADRSPSASLPAGAGAPHSRRAASRIPAGTARGVISCEVQPGEGGLGVPADAEDAAGAEGHYTLTDATTDPHQKAEHERLNAEGVICPWVFNRSNRR
jgi:hypothetical protein